MSTSPGGKQLYAAITMTERKTNTKERKAILATESLAEEMPKQTQEGLGMVACFFFFF